MKPWKVAAKVSWSKLVLVGPLSRRVLTLGQLLDTAETTMHHMAKTRKRTLLATYEPGK